MAVLVEQSSKSINPFAEQVKDDLAPAGTWVSTCIDVRDQFGVVRPSFDNPQIMETVDLTTFLFGFRDQAGQPHRIASKTMRISGNEKSTLFGFLKGLLGAAPKYGWDYCSLKGQKFLITVAHEAKHNGGGVFPVIAAQCPVPASMTGGNGGQRTEAGGNGGQRTEAGGQRAAGGNAQPAISHAQPTQVAPSPTPPAAVEVAAYDEPLPF